MKRKIVQHGPSTLTISLPAKWAHERKLTKGGEVTLEEVQQGLLITTEHGAQLRTKRISVRGMPKIIKRAVGALYKKGYDEIMIEYETTEELEEIYRVISKVLIGFEIIEEDKSMVRIKNISEPSSADFKAIFRRIFYFLLSVAEDGQEAATKHDKFVYEKLILRDININKLADFCRRVINNHGQSIYDSNTAIYHIVEELERTGDRYKELNQHLLQQEKTSKEFLNLYEKTNALLRDYEALFFTFTLLKMDHFLIACRRLLREIENRESEITRKELHLLHLLEEIIEGLFNIGGSTLILNL